MLYSTQTQSGILYTVMSFSNLAPCAPTGIIANLQCGSNNLVVSWNQSAAALNYTVKAVPLDGSQSPAYCVSSHLNCTLPTLQCGLMYDVFVKASSSSCSSPYSYPRTIHTGKGTEENSKTILRTTLLMRNLTPCCFLQSSLSPSGFDSSRTMRH